ncbi:hypothetical protein [Oerskovia flava]|uniref:hypothetical protein n=1 Tax=Oerskovia flava TaxID=2986422 RepID=UPI00223EF55A|nr:hypothetical protein [Oerskovia sp. JB1-3-2]
MDEDAPDGPTPVWSAEDLLTDPMSGIALDRTSWASASGDYGDLANFWVEFETDSVGFGDAVINRERLRGLPPNTFWVEGERMTIAQYRELVSVDLPCEE